MFGVASSAAADWRTEVGTFRIGMIAASAPPPAGLAALRKSYAAALDMPVDFFVARDFSMLIDAQASSRIDYAIYSATAYATASVLCQCVEPVSAAIDVDGAVGIRSVLLARTDTALRLPDIAKTKLAVSPGDSLSGWQAPLGLLGKDGLVLRGDEPFLLKTESTGAAEQAFLGGSAGAILGWERVMDGGEPLQQGSTMDRLRRGGLDETSVSVLWRSPIIRYGPHAVLKSLDREAKDILHAYLAGLYASEPQAYDLLSGGHAGGFSEVGETDYETAKEIVRAMAQ